MFWTLCVQYDPEIDPSIDFWVEIRKTWFAPIHLEIGRPDFAETFTVVLK